jgi:hypothetical protein
MLNQTAPPPAPWDRVWSRLLPCFERCGEAVEREVPVMQGGASHHTGGLKGPFDTYVGFMRDQAQQPYEDLAVWVDFTFVSPVPRAAVLDATFDRGPYVVRCYIQRGNGEELAELATTLPRGTWDDDWYSDAVDEYVESVCAFVRDQTPFIIETLREAAKHPWEDDE